MLLRQPNEQLVMDNGERVRRNDQTAARLAPKFGESRFDFGALIEDPRFINERCTRRVGGRRCESTYGITMRARDWKRAAHAPVWTFEVTGDVISAGEPGGHMSVRKITDNGGLP